MREAAGYEAVAAVSGGNGSAGVRRRGVGASAADTHNSVAAGAPAPHACLKNPLAAPPATPSHALRAPSLPPRLHARRASIPGHLVLILVCPSNDDLFVRADEFVELSPGEGFIAVPPQVLPAG